MKQTQQKQTCIYNTIYYNRKWTPEKLKPGLVASYNLLPGRPGKEPLETSDTGFMCQIPFLLPNQQC